MYLGVLRYSVEQGLLASKEFFFEKKLNIQLMGISMLSEANSSIENLEGKICFVFLRC